MDLFQKLSITWVNDADKKIPDTNLLFKKNRL